MAEVKKEGVKDRRQTCSITLNERGYIFYDDGELVPDSTITNHNCLFWVFDMEGIGKIVLPRHGDMSLMALQDAIQNKVFYIRKK